MFTQFTFFNKNTLKLETFSVFTPSCLHYNTALENIKAQAIGNISARTV